MNHHEAEDVYALEDFFRGLVNSGDSTAQDLDAKLQRAAEEYELRIGEMRDYARLKRAEK